MGKLMISLSDELEAELRKRAKDRFGNRRGAVSFYLEDVLKLYFRDAKV